MTQSVSSKDQIAPHQPRPLSQNMLSSVSSVIIAMNSVQECLNKGVVLKLVVVWREHAQGVWGRCGSFPGRMKRHAIRVQAVAKGHPEGFQYHLFSPFPPFLTISVYQRTWSCRIVKAGLAQSCSWLVLVASTFSWVQQMPPSRTSDHPRPSTL